MTYLTEVAIFQTTLALGPSKAYTTLAYDVHLRKAHNVHAGFVRQTLSDLHPNSLCIFMCVFLVLIIATHKICQH